MALESRLLLSSDATSTVLTSSAASIVYGSSVTLTATVTDVDTPSTHPTRTVTFKDGTTTLGTGTLSGGVATYTITNLTAGVHGLTAIYGGVAGSILGSASVATPDGTISTIAGGNGSGYSGDGGQATDASIGRPIGTTTDSAGNLYIADFNNNVIRKVSSAGIISTVAGNGTAGYSGDGGAATAAEIRTPTGTAVDSSGNLYIADDNNNVIRKVTPAGIISSFAGIGNGTGTGNGSYTGDGGQATDATLNAPFGVAVDFQGDVFIADYANNAIREVTPDGIITTLAGLATNGYGDDGPASASTIAGPSGVSVDAAGDLFFAESAGNSILKILGGRPCS